MEIVWARVQNVKGIAWVLVMGIVRVRIMARQAVTVSTEISNAKHKEKRSILARRHR